MAGTTLCGDDLASPRASKWATVVTFEHFGLLLQTECNAMLQRNQGPPSSILDLYQPALFLQPRARSGVVVGSGTGVGTVVGSGTGVGTVVGSGTGTVVGRGVGAVVGSGVGAVVGSGVGAVVGSRDGMVVGSGIGTVVGSGR
jgi:hypothetical protein